MSIIVPNTKDILKPFTTIDSDDRSTLESCKAAPQLNNLWCDKQTDDSVKSHQQMLAHVWKICIDICHDFMKKTDSWRGMDDTEQGEYWEQIDKIGQKVDAIVVRTTTTKLSGAFAEWRTSPFYDKYGKKSDKERHGLFALLNPYITEPTLLDMAYSFFPNKDENDDQMRQLMNKNRDELTRNEINIADEKGVLVNIQSQVNTNTFATSLEASTWGQDMLAKTIIYGNNEKGENNYNYTDSNPVPPTPNLFPPGHENWNTDRKTFACILDPATRKGHGSLEHYLWKIYEKKTLSSVNEGDINTQRQRFFDECTDCLKESFQHFLDVFINPLADDNHRISKMIIQSSIDGKQEDNKVFLEINNNVWYYHVLADNVISKVGERESATANTGDGRLNLQDNDFTVFNKGNYVTPPASETRPTDSVVILPLMNFFKELKMDGYANNITFIYSYKSLGDWIQVVYLKKLNKLVNDATRSDSLTSYNLGITLSHTSNDKYVIIDSFCACLVILITAVKTEHYRGGGSTGGAFQLRGGGKGIQTMSFLGIALHKSATDPDIYRPTLKKNYGIELSDDEVIWGGDDKITVAFYGIFSSYLTNQLDKARTWINKVNNEMVDPDQILNEIIPSEDQSIFTAEYILTLIIHRSPSTPSPGTTVPNVTMNNYQIQGITFDDDKKKKFLKELNRFCKALQITFDDTLLENIKDIYDEINRISDDIAAHENIIVEVEAVSNDDDDADMIKKITGSLKDVINYFKFISVKCHQLYQLNINELLEHVRYSINIVLVEDYKFNSDLSSLFEAAIAKLLKLNDKIRKDVNTAILITEDGMDEIRSEAIEKVISSFSADIAGVESIQTGRRSARGQASKEAERLNKISALTQRKNNKEASINLDVRKVDTILQEIKSIIPPSSSESVGGGEPPSKRQRTYNKEEDRLNKKIKDIEDIRAKLEHLAEDYNDNITRYDLITGNFTGYPKLVFGENIEKMEDTTFAGGTKRGRDYDDDPDNSPKKARVKDDIQDDDYDIIDSSIFKIMSTLIEIRNIGYLYLRYITDNRFTKYNEQLEAFKSVENAMGVVKQDVMKEDVENTVVDGSMHLNALLFRFEDDRENRRERKALKPLNSNNTRMTPTKKKPTVNNINKEHFKTMKRERSRAPGDSDFELPPTKLTKIFDVGGGAKKTRMKSKSSKLRKTIKKRILKKIKRKSIRRRKPIKKRIHSKNRKVKRKIKNKTRKYKKPKKHKRSRKPKPKY